MDARKPRERLLGPALRTQPDRRLVALARGGSEPAQEEIVRRYRPALVRYATSIVGAAAAEDVVQEALTKGTRSLGRADEELRLRPWLYAIVRNTALNHLRDAAPATEQLDENYDGVEQPPQALERRERVRSLVGGLRELPAQQREALVKRELEGRSHAEIGEELGVSTGAARQLIFRARESLRVGFGSLLPMPLLRWLAEGGGDGGVGVAAGAGGGAVAAKAAVAIFAAGAAVTAGVAVDHGGGMQAQPAAAESGVRPAMVAPVGGAAVSEPRSEPVAVEPSSSGPGSGGAGRGEHGGNSGPGGGGDDSSGPGSGSEVAGGVGRGPRPSANSGPSSRGGHGSGDDHGDDQVDDHHGSSGRSGPGGSDDDGSHGGTGGGSHSGSSGSGESSSSSGSSSTGDSGSSGSGDSGSSDSGGGGDFSEPSRDLSGGSVSQGSDDPD